MSVLSILIDLFLPRKCPFCQRFIYGQRLLCENCEEELPYTGDEKKQWRVKDSVECFAPLWYRGKTVEAVRRYKFRGSPHYHHCFGQLIKEVLTQEQADQFDLISWVPLGQKRYAQRGYNQAELLGRTIAQEFDLTPKALLYKWKENTAQSDINDDDARADNVKEVYCLLDEVDNLENLKILLVDDVITTGSTVESCVNVLKEAGACEVVCLALARSRK